MICRDNKIEFFKNLLFGIMNLYNGFKNTNANSNFITFCSKILI